MFSASEKLIVSMLRDLYKPEEDRELDPDLIWEMVVDGDGWALDREYPGIFHDSKIETPPYVSEVCDILDMWTAIETSYEQLGKTEKQALAEQVQLFGKDPHFRGFDGNHETDQLHAVRILIKKLNLWEEFADRDLNSHMPTLNRYRSMLPEYEKRRDEKSMTMGPLDLEDLVAILNSGRPQA